MSWQDVVKAVWKYEEQLLPKQLPVIPVPLPDPGVPFHYISGPRPAYPIRCPRCGAVHREAFMKADIGYEVRDVKFDGEGYGGTYTERTLWRVLVVDGKTVGEGVPIAKFTNNAEASLFLAWVKEHSK